MQTLRNDGDNGPMLLQRHRRMEQNPKQDKHRAPRCAVLGLSVIPDSVSDEQAIFVGDILATGYWAAKISENAGSLS